MDIINHFKRLNKIDLINSFIFTELQNQTFNYLEKPNIFIDEEISLYEKNEDKGGIKCLIQEYKERIKNKTLDKFDQKLILLLLEKVTFQIV